MADTAPGFTTPRAAAPSPPGSPDPDPVGLEHSLEAVGRGSLVTLFGSIAQLFLTSVAYVIAVRVLTISQWGEYILGVSITGLLSLVGLLGLGQAMARSLAYETDPAERLAIVRWGLGVSAVAAVALSSTVFFVSPELAAPFHDPGLVPVLQLMSVTVGLTIIATTYASIFQGFKDAVPKALIMNAATGALFTLFLLVLIFFRVGFLEVVIAYVLANVASLGLMFTYAWRRLPRHLRTDVTAHRRPRKSLWHYTVAFWGSSNLMYITAYADTLILGVFWPSKQVGYYSAAMTLTRILLFGTLALAFIILPVTANLLREGKVEAIRRTYLTSTRWGLVLTLPFFLLFAFAPRASMEFVWGHRYLPGATALQILVISSFLSSIAGPVQSCLAGLGKAKVLVWTALVSAGANLALSVTLIPTFGAIGAAVAWGVARALLPLLGLGVLWGSHRITPFRRTLLEPLGLTLLIGGLVVVAATTVIHTVWVVVPLFFFGAGLYLFCILVTRSVTRDDLVLVKSVERFLDRPLPQVREFLDRYIREPAPAPLQSTGR